MSGLSNTTSSGAMHLIVNGQQNEFSSYLQEDRPPPTTNLTINEVEDEGDQDDEDLLDLDGNQVSKKGLVRKTSKYVNAPVTRDYSRLSFTQNPRVQQHWRTILAAFLLVLSGFVFVLVGIITEATDAIPVGGYIFFIVAGACLLPGLYQTYFLYNAVKGRKGFHFSNIPGFD